MTPADGKAGKWGKDFPFIANWLEKLLGEEQLEYEKAWLSYAYQGAHAGDPKSGHAHFLLGPPGCGKTLYNTQVLAPLFGGHIKASEYLTSKTDFNDYLFEVVYQHSHRYIVFLYTSATSDTPERICSNDTIWIS